MSHPLQQDPAQTQPQLAAMEEAADNFPDFVLSEKLPCPECHERCKTPQALANHIKIHTRGNAKPINERRKKRKTPEAQPAANCVITNGELTSISIDPLQGCGWDWEVATPGFGFMPTIECAHSLKLLVGDKLLTFTPKSGSSSSQLLCRFTWNPLMSAQGADREALKREPHADDSSTRVPVHQVTAADESSGSNEDSASDINEEWESDTSETSDESDASDISGSGKSDAGDRDIGNGVTPNESDAGNASNARNAQEANSQSCAVTGSPMTTPLPTCPAAAHSDHHHLDFLCLPVVQDLKENDADAAQQTGQVQEDLVNWLMEGGAEEREELSDDDDEEEDNAVVLCRTFDKPSNASQDSDDSNKKSTQVATSTELPPRSSSVPGAHFSPQGAPTCPTCERTFRTRQGLAGHRVAGHCRKKDDKMTKDDKKTGIPSVSGSDVPPFAPTLPWD